LQEFSFLFSNPFSSIQEFIILCPESHQGQQ
jgi:hypothetical protein